VVNVTLLDVEPGYDFVFLRPAANASAAGAFGAAWIRLTGRDRCGRGRDARVALGVGGGGEGNEFDKRARWAGLGTQLRMQ
jgi:hypothetical protein